MDKEQAKEQAKVDWQFVVDSAAIGEYPHMRRKYVQGVLYAADKIAELTEELENERLRLAVCAAESDMALIDQVVNLKKDVKFWKLECCNWQDLNTKIEEENRQLEDARRWVSVSEKLPPTGKTVMVFRQAWLLPCPATYLDRDYFLKEYDDPNYMESGFYPDEGFLFDLPETLIYPTHWQPFVEPLTTPPEEWSASPPDFAPR